MRWYERAAYHGSTAAAFNVAHAAQTGRGTPVDVGRAIHWYEGAARSGMVLAGNNLAILYADSANGHPDLVRARAWLKFVLPDASGAVRERVSENLGAMEREMRPVDIGASEDLVRSGQR